MTPPKDKNSFLILLLACVILFASFIVNYTSFFDDDYFTAVDSLEEVSPKMMLGQ
ncbi:MAG: hypothetical protein WC686_00345 [Candidatus Shapirobacteria bacterium]|jgi:hypothetical protein